MRRRSVLHESAASVHDRSTVRPSRADRLWLVLLAMGCPGCQPVRDPPPSVYFEALPASGTLRDAQRAGFTDCVDMDAVHIRCRRHGVIVVGSGPYDAAVDLEGSRGQGGFRELTLWHDRDNDAVFRIANILERAGWTKCFTGDGRWGDQAIYTRSGAPIRFSMDISYWAKRRMRMIPESNRHDRGCTPA